MVDLIITYKRRPFYRAFRRTRFKSLFGYLTYDLGSFNKNLFKYFSFFQIFKSKSLEYSDEFILFAQEIAGGAEYDIYWPPQKEQKRVYIRVFGEELRFVVVDKSIPFPDVDIPSSWNRYITCIVPTIGQTFNLYYSSSEYLRKGRTVKKNRLKLLEEFLVFKENDAIVVDELHIGNKEIKNVLVCPSHCDLASNNILRNTAGTLYLIDWESYSKYAPYLTDRMSAWLGDNMHIVKHFTSYARYRFHQYFNSFQQKDLRLAVDYLESIGILEIKYVRCWL